MKLKGNKHKLKEYILTKTRKQIKLIIVGQRLMAKATNITLNLIVEYAWIYR